MKKIIFSVLTILIPLTLITATITVCDGDSCKKINLNEQKQVTLKEQEKITINNNEYEAQSGSKFVFNSKEELTDGTDIFTKKGTFDINGLKIDLPEDSHITIQKGKVTINIPKDSKISLNGETDSLVEFNSDGEIELGKGIKIQGVLEKSKRQKTQFFFDPNEKAIYFNKAEIMQTQIGLINSPNTYLFKDEVPKDFDKPAIAIKENFVLLKGSKTEESPSLTYEKENQKLTTQALKNGELELKFNNNQLEITTKKNYYIINGNIIEKNGQIKKLNKKGYEVFIPSEKPIPLQVIHYNDDTTKSSADTFYNIDGKIFFTGKIGEQGISKKQDNSISTDKEKIKVQLASLSIEELEKYAQLSSEEKKRFFLKASGEENIKDALETIGNLPNNNIKISNAPEYAKYDNNPQFRDPAENILLNVHEDIHLNINQPLSQGDYRAFYLGNGEYALVKKTGDAKSNVVKYVPIGIVSKGGFDNYFGPIFTNRDATHVFEDVSAFQGGLKAGFNQAKNGKNFGFEGDLSYTSDFNIYSLALGLQVETENKNYWNSQDGVQFRGYLKRALEDGSNLINEAYTDNRLTSFRYEGIKDEYGRDVSLQKRIQLFRTSNDPKVIALRDFAKRTYGSAWTKKYLGF